MKCKHNFQQLIAKNGKPVNYKNIAESTMYTLYCVKCGETKDVG